MFDLEITKKDLIPHNVLAHEEYVKESEEVDKLINNLATMMFINIEVNALDEEYGDFNLELMNRKEILRPLVNTLPSHMAAQLDVEEFSSTESIKEKFKAFKSTVGSLIERIWNAIKAFFKRIFGTAEKNAKEVDADVEAFTEAATRKARCVWKPIKNSVVYGSALDITKNNPTEVFIHEVMGCAFGGNALAKMSQKDHNHEKETVRFAEEMNWSAYLTQAIRSRLTRFKRIHEGKPAVSWNEHASNMRVFNTETGVISFVVTKEKPFGVTYVVQGNDWAPRYPADMVKYLEEIKQGYEILANDSMIKETEVWVNKVIETQKGGKLEKDATRFCNMILTGLKAYSEEALFMLNGAKEFFDHCSTEEKE